MYSYVFHMKQSLSLEVNCNVRLFLEIGQTSVKNTENTTVVYSHK